MAYRWGDIAPCLAITLCNVVWSLGIGGGGEKRRGEERELAKTGCVRERYERGIKSVGGGGWCILCG